ncbi:MULTISPECIES: apolipoprotein N-acyltransferase [unclassified Microbacterium]|uniref:apolipoprotein N-acyltransferase n=1 Tax=Microbacterium sp. JZ37 TaxID=2654193 RepID=UPI002B49D1B8|nr:apolipoprotein N-acyltransferase [Microbacterium sp. JZ37]WRH17234.1 apolipoprotein N-acyltransferase [Microbacterium sp. JZ37]
MPERPLLPLWAAAVAAAAGGLALDAAFPAVGIWPLAFPAVALSLASLVGRRIASALLVGFVFALAFYLPHVSWAAGFLGDNPFAWVPWVALAVVEAALMAIGAIPLALAYRWLPRASRAGAVRLVVLPVAVAMLWTWREATLGSWPYGGFAWGRVGMSQSESPLAPLSSWIGVSGITFVIVLVCALAIEAVRMARSAHRAGRRVLALVAPAALLGVLMLVPPFPTAPAGEISVGAVQGNGPAAYLDAREPYDVLNAQITASEPLRDADVDVVLWPEGGVDSDPLYNETTALYLDTVVGALDAPLLMNAASARGGDPTSGDDPIYNTSMLWTEDGATQLHSKRHPVPFGEYVPDRPLFEALAPDLIGLIQREYTPGDDSPVFDVGGVGIGLAICFDVISDSLIAEGIADGAEVFMFQTNNADFRGTDENLQQLAFARMRAIETGRSVVNLSTTGTSQIIAADGSVVDALPIDEAGAMIADVELREGTTAGVVVGPWVQGAMAFGLVLVAAAGLLARRRRRA